MDLTQFREMYSSDVVERLVRMNHLILSLEADPTNREMIDTLFRETHSLKGMAASMQYNETEKLSHHLESLLDPGRKSGEISIDVIDRLLSGIDLLKGLLDDIDNDRPEHPVDLTLLLSPHTTSAPADASPTISLPPPTLLTDLQEPSKDLARPAIPRHHKSETDYNVRIRTELLDQLINLSGELTTNRFMLQSARMDGRWSDLDSGLENLGKLVENLHHQMLQARMTPLKKITSQLPRLVRDLGRKTGKDVKLIMTGEHLELDRSILELLADPLIHLIRNAVDHGIENRGEITLRAWREQNMAFLEVADNGRGIQPDTIRNKVVETGLMTRDEVEMLGEKELLQIICAPGFSTSATAGEISGRGVGMNVVKKTVDSLSGILEITSTPGSGSVFLLKLPLKIFIIRILLVRCAGRIIGLPITRILHVQELIPDGICRPLPEANDIQHYPLQHLVSLASLLNLEETPVCQRGRWVAFTEINGKIIGVVFDGLIGQREAYVKPLSSPLNQLNALTGATVLGDGQIIFIVDPLILLQKEMSYHT